jgi:hypothetical protein
MRAWLVQLEQRVTEIEREAERVRRARRRSWIFMALAGALYLVLLFWETSLF